ncbi:hypothetical protein V5799_003313 [Amblyomma americanum]|uniref:Uncharacterized protein n=1 Tax=Amblyomma americanum TaxID=6943 RepID=A0AAQ4D9B4_AMBAM
MHVQKVSCTRTIGGTSANCQRLSTSFCERSSLCLKLPKQSCFWRASIVIQCKRLYGVVSLTFNVHVLLHLANCARSLGPLWAHSAFVFEGGNGHIVRQVSAANGIPQQIVERIIMHQQLRKVMSSSFLCLHDKEFCMETFGYPRLQKATHVGKLCLLGKGKDVALSAEEQDAVNNRLGTSTFAALQYERFVQAKQVFHSTAY